ncbi:hypothetical protein G6F32_015654 [Rhizopus arrhizus]|nr:hypothetical protein G6F32_015654 [Rhizopus arrhizus]
MPHRTTVFRCLLLAVALAAGPATAAADAANLLAPTLLFHVDANHGLQAATAQGEAVPNFRDKVAVVDDGVRGKAIHAALSPSTGARAMRWARLRS